ncbi:hypothetical protein ACFPRL_04770 [Pseudoclavibacter helvolus]
MRDRLDGHERCTATARTGEPSRPAKGRGSADGHGRRVVSTAASPTRFSMMTPPSPRNASWNGNPADAALASVWSGLSVSTPMTLTPTSSRRFAIAGSKNGWSR